MGTPSTRREGDPNCIKHVLRLQVAQTRGLPDYRVHLTRLRVVWIRGLQDVLGESRLLIRKRHNPLDDGFNQGKGVRLFTEDLAGSKIANEGNFMDPGRFRILGK